MRTVLWHKFKNYIHDCMRKNLKPNYQSAFQYENMSGDYFDIDHKKSCDPRYGRLLYNIRGLLLVVKKVLHKRESVFFAYKVAMHVPLTTSRLHIKKILNYINNTSLKKEDWRKRKALEDATFKIALMRWIWALLTLYILWVIDSFKLSRQLMVKHNHPWIRAKPLHA